VQVGRDRLPDRRRAADAADVVHRRTAGVADPDADRVAVGEADAPVVAHVLARSGLHRGEAARRERLAQPKVRTRALLSARMSATRTPPSDRATRAEAEALPERASTGEWRPPLASVR
jgi:hypothetical protein